MATLLMVAVAVAMSVIIFMWSQGFLAQTSEATGSQQGSQNQAAQSSISIESSLFVAAASTDTNAKPKITVIVRNVGAVAITLGSISITGVSSNVGFKGNLLYTWTTSASTDITETSGTWTIAAATDISSEVLVQKGSSVTLALTESGTALASTDDTYLSSGDTVTIKITTAAGTFAQSTFTVP
ncbi:MAG: hypothetical protein HYU39_04740 [Thaumarchaeota archaeon]|nr:hypothetical protein [Nitrososphaerota archaeon]